LRKLEPIQIRCEKYEMENKQLQEKIKQLTNENDKLHAENLVLQDNITNLSSNTNTNTNSDTYT